MSRYVFPISVFAVVIFKNACGVTDSNVKIENDSSEGATKSEQAVEQWEKTMLIFNFTPRGKRDIFSRRRKTSEQLELLKISERGRKLHVERCKEVNSEIQDAAEMYASRNKGKNRYVNSCVICEVSFSYDKDYMDHCAETHGTLHSYRCIHCERKFKWKRNLKQHMDQKHDKKANAILLRWNDEEFRGITCEICGERHKNWVAFEHHALAKHENERMMACSYCPKKFFRRRSLFSHVRWMHNSGGDSIDEGECKLFRTRVFQTTECTKERERCEGKHSKQEHIGNLKEKIKNDEDGPINLKSPGNAMTIAKSQEGEKNRNDSSNYDGMTVTGKHKQSRRIYTCPHCNINVIGLVKYEKHGKRMHEGLPLYRCLECQKGFFQRNTITIHYKEKHKNDKTRCSYCSNCYSKLGDLRKHEYACEKKTRNEAMRKEQGLPSYTCDICKKEFYMKWKTFRKHVNRHETYVFCHICKQGFSKSKSHALAEHIRVRHPLLENIDALLQMAAKVKVKCENVSD